MPSGISTSVLIHGAGDSGWYWHRVEPALRSRGHDVVAPDLPRDDAAAQLTDYADTVVASVGERRQLIVVGQSFGGFTAPLVADRLRADLLVFVALMVPVPGEPRFVLCTQDRFFPTELMRRLVHERLHMGPDEIAAGHCVALGRPKQLARILLGYVAKPRDGH